MSERGLHTRSEIFSQPETWATCLDTFAGFGREVGSIYERGNFDQVIFSGCGSPYYAALSAASIYQQYAQRPAQAFPASELIRYPEACYLPGKRYLLVVLSRSGETTELLRACEAFKEDQRGEIITISCVPGKPLTRLGDINLVFPEAMEQSLAQTRALSSLHLITSAMNFTWAGRNDLQNQLKKLPEIGQSLLERYAGWAEKLGSSERFSRFYFLGSGPRHGLARELSLKMKETSLAHSEPFHVLEFRHGPKTMVNTETLLLLLASSGDDRLEVAVGEESRAAGAEVVISGDSGVDVNFASGLHEVVQHVLHLPFGQLVAYNHSISRGLNPDLPENLNAVVIL